MAHKVSVSFVTHVQSVIIACVYKCMSGNISMSMYMCTLLSTSIVQQIVLSAGRLLDKRVYFLKACIAGSSSNQSP